MSVLISPKIISQLALLTNPLTLSSSKNSLTYPVDPQSGKVEVAGEWFLF